MADQGQPASPGGIAPTVLSHGGQHQSTPPRSASAPLTSGDDWLVGQTLVDRYKVEKKLGEGGMGAVYLARHIALEKLLALKVLHGEFSRKPELVERFLQEARAASRIRHPHVIDITDFGATPDGVVFFAMEMLTGQDLSTVLAELSSKKQVMPWARAGKVFLQVCDALAAAHEQGIIHRDLKPENIFLVERGSQSDFVKLLDFGIAKLTEVSDDARKLTRTGMLFGTPEYMSPEQARGEKPDARVDVYAMGCILYQLVAGQVPFDSDNFMGILTQHLTTPPPELTPPILARAMAPSEINRIVQKALAKQREDRYFSVVELANEVRRVSGRALDATPSLMLGHDRSGPMAQVPVAISAQSTVPIRPSPSKAVIAVAIGAVILMISAGLFFAGKGSTPAAAPPLPAATPAVIENKGLEPAGTESSPTPPPNAVVSPPTIPANAEEKPVESQEAKTTKPSDRRAGHSDKPGDKTQPGDSNANSNGEPKKSDKPSKSDRPEPDDIKIGDPGLKTSEDIFQNAAKKDEDKK